MGGGGLCPSRALRDAPVFFTKSIQHISARLSDCEYGVEGEKKKPRITSSRAKKPSPRLLGCQNHPDGASSPARAVRVRWGRRNRKRKRRRRRRRRGEQSAELQRDSPKQNTFFRERGSDSLTCPNREKARRESLGEK